MGVLSFGLVGRDNDAISHHVNECSRLWTMIGDE